MTLYCRTKTDSFRFGHHKGPLGPIWGPMGPRRGPGGPWLKPAGRYDSKNVCTISVGQTVWELLMVKVRCKNCDTAEAAGTAGAGVQAPILDWIIIN